MTYTQEQTDSALRALDMCRIAWKATMADKTLSGYAAITNGQTLCLAIYPKENRQQSIVDIYFPNVFDISEKAMSEAEEKLNNALNNIDTTIRESRIAELEEQLKALKGE